MHPKTLKNGFTLIASLERSQTHPDTWAHPHDEALKRIEVGYFVKVGVTHPDLSGERFWGLVKERAGPGIVIEVDQDTCYADQHGISDKDILSVTERNVSGIVADTGVTVWEAK
jgi:hypothetical protein